MTDHFEFTFKKSETGLILPVFIRDGSVTTGLGLGSLDQTSSIVGAYMKRDGLGISLAVDENVITEGTYEAPTTDNQVRIGTPANAVSGSYELHFHNDLFTTEDYVFISLGGASNMRPITIRVNLWDFDPNATPIVITDILSDGTAINMSSGVLDTVNAVQTIRLTKNTAFSNFSFLMVENSDHVTGKTGLSFAASNSQRKIDSGSFVNTDNVPVEDSNGIYRVNFTADDMNGNVITFKFTGAGADTRFITIITQ